MRYMFLPFRRYADFQGRSRRLEFWLFALLNAIVSFVFTIVFVALFFGVLVDLVRRYGASAYATTYDTLGLEAFGMGWSADIPPDVLLAEIGPLGIAILGLMCLYSLIVFIPALAVVIRRLHDADRSGWWILINLIPVIGSIVLFVFFLIEGARGPNRFGPDPKPYGGPPRGW